MVDWPLSYTGNLSPGVLSCRFDPVTIINSSCCPYSTLTNKFDPKCQWNESRSRCRTERTNNSLEQCLINQRDLVSKESTFNPCYYGWTFLISLTCIIHGILSRRCTQQLSLLSVPVLCHWWKTDNWNDNKSDTNKTKHNDINTDVDQRGRS